MKKELSITRSGDVLLRKLLVQCAQYILGPHGPECDLRRVGRKLAARGGKAAKRKAVVAVARRLAVMLHRIWVTGVAYDPNLWSDINTCSEPFVHGSQRLRMEA